ncbi:hypothetical protein CORC01_00910 [Colletotrichum orchidophilum]|uniref:Hemerythrin-like domain-containing protein n=1 Tax=Colletotrichum orchidophilum TaxID=1209926 RepID=A0A1G4BQ40_9PEZI|nr:uncharacterized protein CORC01_00910 [Colletotrichum orchidophilum]OHF03591.1 hypothetical protein CORC01_00910 [Colletotrichum orchidophilum]
MGQHCAQAQDVVAVTAHLIPEPCHRTTAQNTLCAFTSTRSSFLQLRDIRNFSAMSSQTQTPTTPAKSQLPPLTPAEFKVFNRMAEKMNYFHNHFRHQWTLLHDAATSGRRPSNMTLKQFIDTGLQFARHLAGHHGVEEAHVFPVLARRMPEFRGGSAGELLQQHKQIHKGMDDFEAYLRACRSRETELELSVLREKMDSWGEVLWTHLDQEVETLGAENMRKYYTMEEIKNLPF